MLAVTCKIFYLVGFKDSCLPVLTEFVLEALQGGLHVDGFGGCLGVVIGKRVRLARLEHLRRSGRRLEVTETPATADSRTRETRSQSATASPRVLQLLLDFGDTLELGFGQTFLREVNDLELVFGGCEGLAPSQNELARQDLSPNEVALIVASSPTRVV